jgi:hypothetical protein
VSNDDDVRKALEEGRLEGRFSAVSDTQLAQAAMQGIADKLAEKNGLDSTYARAFVFEVLTVDEVVHRAALRDELFPEQTGDSITKWVYAAADLLMDRMDVRPGWIGGKDQPESGTT